METEKCSLGYLYFCIILENPILTSATETFQVCKTEVFHRNAEQCLQLKKRATVLLSVDSGVPPQFSSTEHNLIAPSSS